MALNSGSDFKNREIEQIKLKGSKGWSELANRLRDEEQELKIMLAAAESFPTEKVIDDWQERNSPSYVEALRHRLQQIRDALLRLSLESYDRCAKCGAKIDSRRLSTDPAVSRCPACK
jgi:RNA polymerase-binding transcription factor DksA